MIKVTTLAAAPQLGSRTSSGRPWRLRAARHSQGEVGPLGAQPLPRVLERAAASKAAHLSAFVRPATQASAHASAASSACSTP